jgi:hypothetical protein
LRCPWDALRQSPLGFCEESLCASIKQPGNTWSNIGFLVVAALIWHHAGKHGHRQLRLIAVVSVVTGIGSAAYHATGTYWGGLVDVGGMYLGTGLLTGLNMRRWRGWSSKGVYATMFAVTSILLSAMLVFHGDNRLMFALAGPCCLIELVLFVQRRRETRYASYLYAWGTMAAATAMWWLDLTQRLCAPQSHLFSGHAAWHMLSAVAYYLLYRFYAQFRIFDSAVTESSGRSEAHSDRP